MVKFYKETSGRFVLNIDNRITMPISPNIFTAYTNVDTFIIERASTNPLEDKILIAVAITAVADNSGVPYTPTTIATLLSDFFSNASTGVSTEAVGAYGFTNDSNGEVDRSTSVLSFNNATREFTITPVGEYSIFYASVKNIISDIKTVAIDDIEGKWYIYINQDNTLVATNVFADSLILRQVLVATIYWDKENQVAIGGVFDERHGYLQDGETHLQLHLSLRTQYRSGLSINTFTIGDGSLDSHAKFIVNSGKIADEDIPHNIATSTNTIPILYSKGVPNVVRELTNTGFAATTTGTGRLAYNRTSDYTLQEVTDNNFVAYHIFGTAGADEDSGQLFSIMGQAEYTTLELAKTGAATEIALIRQAYVLSNEMKDIGSIIFQTNSTYTNALKAKIVDISTGVHYLDWRFSAPIPSSLSPIDHDSSNPKLATNGVQFGHIDDIAQTITGDKTFTGTTKGTTQATGNSTTAFATTAFVQTERALDVALAGAQTITGNKSFSGVLTTSGPLVYTGIITPPALTGNADNYNPTNFSICNTIRQAATGGNRTITGFAAQIDGFEFTLFNLGTSSIIISSDSASSIAANRVLTPNAASMTIRTQGSATFWYDITSTRWRVKTASL